MFVSYSMSLLYDGKLMNQNTAHQVPGIHKIVPAFERPQNTSCWSTMTSLTKPRLGPNTVVSKSKIRPAPSITVNLKFVNLPEAKAGVP